MKRRIFVDTINLKEEAEKSSVRVDQWLAQQDLALSRSRVAELIKLEKIQVNSKAVKASLCVKVGDIVDIEIPDIEPSSLQAYDFKLDVVYEDDHLIVVNKPPGLVVHPAAGHAHDTLVNALIHYTDDLAVGFGESRPGIVHRIDKETSGLLLVAKTNLAQEKLSQGFREKSINRIYEAIVLGRLKNSTGTLESTLARHPTNRKKFASIRKPQSRILKAEKSVGGPEAVESSAGRWARTHYKVLKSLPQWSLVELKLDTGRTHQIRVHMSELGHPLLGDILYGFRSRESQLKNWPRVALHAKHLSFHHPVTGEFLSFEVDWPEDILSLLGGLGLRS